MPPGLALAGSCGVLSGTPSWASSHSCTVTASNGVAPAATQAVTIEVRAAVYLPLVLRQGYLIGEASIRNALALPTLR